MKKSNSPYYAWVPPLLGDAGIFLLVLAQTLVTGVSTYSVNEVTAGLGEESEVIRIAVYAGSIGLAAMLPVYYRLRLFWRRKTLLLVFLAAEAALCIIAPLLRYGWEFVAVSFLIGAVKCICLVDAIGLLMARFNPQNSRGRFYGLYYPVSFAGGQLAGFAAAWGLIHYSWSFTYYVALPGILLSMAMVLLLMHPQRQGRRVPLYQVDWPGCALFTAFAFSLVYVCVYGQRLQWLASGSIRVGLACAALFLALFLYRQLTLKRPFLHPGALRLFPQVRLGITLMAILYLVYNTGGIQQLFMERVLHYDHVRVARASLYMIPSFLLFIPLSGWLLHRHYPVRILLLAGFGLFAACNFISARLFAPSVTAHYLVLPQLLKGAAYGTVITTLSYYASTNVLREYNGHRAFLSVCTRYVVAMPLSGALLGEWMLRARRQHYTVLSAALQEGSMPVQQFLRQMERLFMARGMTARQAGEAALAALDGRIQQQAILLAGENIFTALGYVSLGLMLLVLLIKKLDVHYLANRNRYSLLDT